MKQALPIAAMLICIAILENTTYAGGHGAYFGWGRGWPSLGTPGFLEDKFPGLDVSVDLTLDHFTVGYVYDSAPTRREYLTYRGTIGFDIASTKLTDQSIEYGGLPPITVPFSGDLFETTGYGFSTKHTLAYTLVSSDTVKCWLGPSLRLNLNYENPDSLEVYTIKIDPWAINVSAGGGFEGGINFNLNPDMSLSLSSGFHYNALGYYLKVNTDFLDFSESSFIWGGEPFVFVELSLLFHTGKDKKAEYREPLGPPVTHQPLLTPLPEQ